MTVVHTEVGTARMTPPMPHVFRFCLLALASIFEMTVLYVYLPFGVSAGITTAIFLTLSAFVYNTPGHVLQKME